MTQARPVTEMTVDVLVLGSGAGGLVSALTAQELGLQALVVEKSVRLGGSSALSGGGIWLPCNPLLESSGVTDTPDLARQYLAAAVGDAGPSASPERQAAFVEGALDMSIFLQRRRVRLVHSWHPDYYAQLPGGLNPGRSVESELRRWPPLGFTSSAAAPACGTAGDALPGEWKYIPRCAIAWELPDTSKGDAADNISSAPRCGASLYGPGFGWATAT